jgi:excisionase family DNA binding protein
MAKSLVRSWDELPMLLTAQQAADVLQLHVNTIKGWCRESKLPARKLGKGWRIAREALQRFVVGEEVRR